TGLVHVDGEVADALMLGHVDIGADKQHAQIGDLATGGPHLLAVHDPLIAVPNGLGVQPGQVRAGTRLTVLWQNSLRSQWLYKPVARLILQPLISLPVLP